MIITLTANPAVDRTIEIDSAIRRGGVYRALRVGDEAGGKGVNVARAVAHAGYPAVAVLPADDDDLLVRGLVEAGVHPVNVPIGHPSRVNITVTEPDGTTTKFNDPGKPFPAGVVARVTEALVERSVEALWVVLSGSLPPGVTPSWYAQLTAILHQHGRRIAVDTSGPPLDATVRSALTLPDLLKPNSEELASLTGADPAQVEDDPALAAALAARLVERGAGSVLATLGGRGAVLVTAAGCWLATPAPIVLKSTVGAGDASLAGYLIAASEGMSQPDRLRHAVAYGSAAASLPGSTMPRVSDIRLGDVLIEPLHLSPTPQ
jgi:1-phosphofructokinase